MTPLWGRVTDIVGRKYILYPGIVVFAAGSALCGASQSMNMLIASRALQGIGGGAIMSLTQIIIGDIVPLAKRGIYNSFFGAVWGISSCVGPVLGKYFLMSASPHSSSYAYHPLSVYRRYSRTTRKQLAMVLLLKSANRRHCSRCPLLLPQP